MSFFAPTAPAATSKSDSKRDLIVLGLLIILGLSLRLYALDSQGFFIDEIYSVLVARGDADPELMAFDSIRPLYFALLGGWMHLGQSELWLRLPSVVFGVLNIVLTYCLGKVSAGHRVGLVAALLMTLSPLEVHYSQQARMYTMGSFLALASSLLLMLAWQKQSLLALLSWGLSRVLMIWTLPLTALLLVVDVFLSVLLQRKDKLFAPFALVFVLVSVGALVFAWKMPLISMFNAYDAWRGTLPVPGLLEMIMVPVNFTSCAGPIQECLGPQEGGPLALLYSAVLLGLTLLSGFVVKEKRALLFPLAWASFTVLFAWAVSQTGTCFLIVRYLLFAAPYAFIAMAAGFDFLCSKSRIAAALLSLLYAYIVPLNLYSLTVHPVHEDWRLATRYIEQNEKAGDTILVWTYHSSYVWNYYYQGLNRERVKDFQVNLPEGGKQLQVGALAADNRLSPIKGRTWIVIRQSIKNWDHDWRIYQSVLAHLKERYHLLKSQSVTKLDVILLEERK